MHIGFYAATDDRVFTGDTIYNEPLGGIQTSIVLLSRELAKYHDVSVFNNTPESCICRGVNYHNLSEFKVRSSSLDVVIILNYEGSAMNDLVTTIPRRIFWKHHNDPFIPLDLMPEFIDNVDAVVFGSRYSMNTYNDIFQSDKYRVIYPCVDMEAVVPADHSDRRDMIYISCPNRGLNLFTKILPRVTDAIPGIQLHSYGTFQVYGNNWIGSDMDHRMRPDYIELSRQPNFHQHRSVSYYEIMKLLGCAMIFTYPCVFLESFGAATAMAMANGTPVITSKVGATRTLYPDYPYNIDIPDDDLGMAHTDEYADEFTNMVLKLWDPEEWNRISNEVMGLSARFDVNVIAREWLHLLEE